MKKLNYIIQSTILILISVFSTAFTTESFIDHLDISLWSEYKADNLSEINQQVSGEKLQKIFEDKLLFVQKHKIRQLIIKILNPCHFDFFHPENFDTEQSNNFGYFASKLCQYTELYALFDSEAFSENKQSSYWSHVSSKKALGEFKNLDEKLKWLKDINEWYSDLSDSYALLNGIVINAKSIRSDEETQNIINKIDQFRTQGLKEAFLHSTCHNFKVGLLLTLDQRDLAFGNLARFPLKTDIKCGKLNSIGLNLPDSFPSEAPRFGPPSWRKETHNPLVDMIYLDMSDSCLSHSIDTGLENPLPSFTTDHKTLANQIGGFFRGDPIFKGPGTITQLKGETEVKGTKTYFKFGGIEENEGQLIKGGKIEVRPPFLSSTAVRTIEIDPQDNKTLSLNSTLSVTDDVIDAPYFYSPLLKPWTTPMISHFIANNIYFVFSTDTNQESNSFIKGWSLEDFSDFLFCQDDQSGFLSEVIYTGPNHTPITTPKNIVLYDYSTLPNGRLSSEYNWNLGNQSH